MLLAALGRDAARAQIYLAYANAGIVSKYDADTGALISENFIAGLREPSGLCLVDGVLYVTNAGPRLGGQI
ncbi:MAG: hypothetical protein WDO13_04350 [Verrucomicrobiota bacterium]